VRLAVVPPQKSIGDKNILEMEFVPEPNKMFRNKIKIPRNINCFVKNVLVKASSKHNQMWSSFEDLTVKNTTVQLKFNLNN